MDVYYFSGSGNSLHIAKELQKRISGTNLIPIVSLLNKDSIKCNANTVGLVFPLHGMTVPFSVKDFLRKAEFNSVEYIFAIATRAGTKCMAFDKIKKELEGKGKGLDSYFVLNMANNDPKFKVYDIPTEEKFSAIESKISSQLDIIAATIMNKEKSCEKDTDHVHSGYLLERLVLLGMFYAEKSKVNNYFYADPKCTGCGTCEKVCLSQKIKMVDNKPVWQNHVKCYLCYACVNYCPKQALQIKTKWYMKSYTDKNGRYPHPYATTNDIANQKRNTEM